MARINWEERVLTDPRMVILIKKLGRITAFGAMIEFWMLAQKFWLRDQLIPEEIFQSFEIPEDVISVGFGERRDGGIYACGSDKYFSWLRAKVENGRKGGVASGASRRETNQPLDRSDAKLRRSDAKPPSSFLLPPSSNTEIHSQKTASNPASAGAHPLLEIWNSNCGTLPKAKGTSTKRKKQMLARWKENPDHSYWTEIVGKISNSKFCTGSNDRAWRATIDFLLQPDTHLKVSEGTYDRGGTIEPVVDEWTLQMRKQAQLQQEGEST